MSALESFLAVLGNRRVVKSLGLLALMAIFLAFFLFLDGVKLGPSAIVVVLIGIAFVVVKGYFRGESDNLIKVIEEVVEENEKSNADDSTEPEASDMSPFSPPLPTLDVVDPATPDSSLIEAFSPTTLSKWPGGNAEDSVNDD